MIDTHCHLTFPDFKGQVDQVMARAETAGVRGCIVVSTSAANAAETLELAQRYPNIWCTSGVHPLYADEPLDWEAIRAVGAQEKCVAWGELGLDHHYDRPPRPLQETVLEQQLDAISRWSEEGLKKPIVVHCRKAVDALLPRFAAFPLLPPDRFVFHCFTGDVREARAILDFGAWISFTGVVTFANAPEVAEAACLVPADRIMVETDAPFLSPEPLRKMRPNEPANVVHVARFIAERRGVDPVAWEHQLDANAQRFFGIRLPEAVR